MLYRNVRLVLKTKNPNDWGARVSWAFNAFWNRACHSLAVESLSTLHNDPDEVVTQEKWDNWDKNRDVLVINNTFDY